MDNTAGVVIGAACLVVAALGGFATYRWRQRGRARQVKDWVNRYLKGRYGELPGNLEINCTDDALWPVLVAFERPRGGTRHSLRFRCHGHESSFALLSEKEVAC